MEITSNVAIVLNLIGTMLTIILSAIGLFQKLKKPLNEIKADITNINERVNKIEHYITKQEGIKEGIAIEREQQLKKAYNYGINNQK